MTENAISSPPSRRLAAIVAWIWYDEDGRERPLEALVRGPDGPVKITLTYHDHPRVAAGADAIARQYARSARVRAVKRRYTVSEDLETIDARESELRPRES